MSDHPSEYLRYLPPFFREEAGDGSSRELLPDLLLVFQKILTGVQENGVEDGKVIRSGPDRPASEPLEAVIDQLDRFFDPYRTDAKFLPWLASWVGLELQPGWTRAESRQMIARTVRLFSRIGLKAGLYDFLEVYAANELAPRVAIDDDEALLRVVPRDDGTAGVTVLAFARIVRVRDAATKADLETPVLYRPAALAVKDDPDPEGGFDLRLMSSVNDVNVIPTEGKNLIIVAAVNNVLHFRIFDGDGKEVVDTDENRLKEEKPQIGQQIEELRKRLENLWPPHQLTSDDKVRVITAVTSIVRHTPEGIRYVVADAGFPGPKYPPMYQPSLWIVTPNGELDELHWSTLGPGGMPVPTPLNTEKIAPSIRDEDFQLSRPTAVAVDADGSVLVLEGGLSYSQGGITVRPAIFRYARDPKNPAGTIRARLVRLGNDTQASSPVDMVLDRTDDPASLVVLDSRPTPRLRVVPLGVDNPQIIDIPLDPKLVITPKAIAQESAGTFVIADARDDANGGPGTLIRVQIKTVAPNTTEVTDLLGKLPADRNSLVYPTGVLVERPGVYVVCDSGVKTASSIDRSFRLRARPPGLFRIQLEQPAGPDGGGIPSITLLASRGLTSPTRMARDRTGAILVTDQGEIAPDAINPEPLPWRGCPHRFGVSVLFSKQNLPPELFEKAGLKKLAPVVSRQLRGAHRDIQTVIDRQKPVQSIQVWKSQT